MALSQSGAKGAWKRHANKITHEQGGKSSYCNILGLEHSIAGYMPAGHDFVAPLCTYRLDFEKEMGIKDEV